MEPGKTIETRAQFLSRLAANDVCYITTTGRVSGRPHRIEIWFSMLGGTIYLLSGDRYRSDWVKNLRRQPEVAVEIAGQRFQGRSRIVSDAQEEAQARRLQATKYQQWQEGLEMSEWARTALPVAIDLVMD